jgi:hypothetical protein
MNQSIELLTKFIEEKQRKKNDTNAVLDGIIKFLDEVSHLRIKSKRVKDYVKFSAGNIRIDILTIILDFAAVCDDDGNSYIVQRHANRLLDLETMAKVSEEEAIKSIMELLYRSGVEL